MGLDAMREDQDLDLYSEEDHRSLLRFKELAIMAMEAVQDGEVAFESMSEVLRALEKYDNARRLLEGGPAVQKGQGETTNILTINVVQGATPKMAVEALLAIANSIDSSDDDDVIDVTPED